MNTPTRFFIFFTIFILILATFNLYKGDFDFLRWTVFLSCLVLIHTTYRSKVTGWMIVFIVISIIFNPFYQFLHFEKEIWRGIDIFVIIGFSIFLQRYYSRYAKGLQFERYISTLFPSNIWVITDRTKDSSKKLKRLVESDTNPDFTFRNKSTGKTIAVECKFRSSSREGKYGDFGIWWSKEQGKRYEMYGSKHKIPVFVAIGIGGGPNNPKRFFFCPLERLNNTAYGFVTEKDLNIFERKNERQFLSDSF